MLADMKMQMVASGRRMYIRAKYSKGLDNYHKKSHSFQNGFYISGKRIRI